MEQPAYVLRDDAEILHPFTSPQKDWVAVKELKLRDYPPIMENQMEKKMENEMETGGIEGFRELKLSYYIGETLLFTIYTHYGNLI